MTKSEGRYFRWTTSVLLTLIWSFLPTNVEADPRLDRKLDDADMDFGRRDNEETFPRANVTLDPGCMQVGATNDTYSVIVHSDNPRVSNLFQEHARMCSYSQGLVSAQLMNPGEAELWEWTPDYPPFHVGHPPGARNRVRIYHTSHKTHHARARVSGRMLDFFRQNTVLDFFHTPLGG